MTAIYCSDGVTNPPKGVLGGRADPAARNFKRARTGELVELPGFHQEMLKAGEALVWVNNGGGGYGDPKRRAPERVAADVNRNWLTVERARDVYGVALKPAQTPGLVVVDVDATSKLRTAD